MTRDKMNEFIEMSLDELKEKTDEELIAFIDEMGYCQVKKNGKPVFYVIHPELFDEVNATLDIYENLLEQVGNYDEAEEEENSNKFRS